MLRKTAVYIGMAATFSISSVAIAATIVAPISGVTRNQAALGVSGRLTPSMRAVAEKCRTSGAQGCGTVGTQHLAGSSGPSLFVLVAASAAGGFGLYEGLHNRHDHHGDNGGTTTSGGTTSGGTTSGGTTSGGNPVSP